MGQEWVYNGCTIGLQWVGSDFGASPPNFGTSYLCPPCFYLSFDATEKSGKDGYVKEEQKSLRLCHIDNRFEQSFLPLTETEFSDTQQNERQIATFYLTVRVYALCTLYTDPIF